MTCIPGRAPQPAEQERNKQIARSFFEEVLGQGHLDRYAESHSEDFVAHAENHEASLEADIAAARAERKALPDMRVTVNQMVAEKDLVVVYWTAVGINTQAGMGIPITGKKTKLMACGKPVWLVRRSERAGFELARLALRGGLHLFVGLLNRSRDDRGAGSRGLRSEAAAIHLKGLR